MFGLVFNLVGHVCQVAPRLTTDVHTQIWRTDSSISREGMPSPKLKDFWNNARKTHFKNIFCTISKILKQMGAVWRMQQFKVGDFMSNILEEKKRLWFYCTLACKCFRVYAKTLCHLIFQL